MNVLIDTAIAHARTVLSALVLVLVAGVVAYVTIPKESNPDIDIPIIYVVMTHDGISPEDAERLLIKPTVIWVTGLAPQVTLITVGQEFVSVGQKVRAVEEDSLEPAAGQGESS